MQNQDFYALSKVKNRKEFFSSHATAVAQSMKHRPNVRNLTVDLSLEILEF